MKYAVLIFLLILSAGVVAQQPKPKATPPKKPAAAKPKPVPTPTPLSEKEQFEKASAHELAIARVAALQKFLKDFPESKDRPAAVDLLASSRVLIAEEKLISLEALDAVALFKLIVEEAPQPIPNELFFESIARIPATLFRHGQRASALEIAGMIEAKVEGNTAQLLEVTNFYLSVENGAEAMRVVAKAAAKDPNSAAVYRTLAQAHRINFDLEGAANAYARALELEPDSPGSKRGLAEMKRALGKAPEAVTLYRELLAKNESDVPAQTGLVLSLFDSGKRTEAESELTRSLEKKPDNFILLAGAAYWYASRGIGDKAVELAQKALDREPRYVWSHIALARGLLSQNKPVAAEQVLVKARSYGNFPTLEYELASVRIAAGFFREAVEDLGKHFTVSGGAVRTHLGGRVAREEKSLTELVAFERKASIFAPDAADTAENSDVLKALLELDQKLQAPVPNEAEIAAAADAFAKGSDKMRLHRQIYAASVLLQKRVAITKVLELTKAATGNTDAALEVADPGAAVMASELYESRAAAFRTNDFLLVPDVPKQTLSAILRGRIEEMTGWALYQQGNFPDAIVRLRRSITVMPDKSAWWRSSMWRLGAALAADGKDADALNAYIESYKTDKPDFAKFVVVEALYKKVNGTTDGLEAKIGSERMAAVTTAPAIQPGPTPIAETPANSSTDVPTTVAQPTTDPPKPEAIKADATVKTEPNSEKTAPAAVETPLKSGSAAADSSKVETKQTVPEPSNETSKPPVVVETKTDDPKTESTGETVQTAKPSVETKSPEQAVGKPAGGEAKETGVKPLFEPIIITIPSSRPKKSDASKVGVEENKNVSTEKAGEKEKQLDPAAISSGATRPRVIDGQEVVLDEPAPCIVGLSQDTVSLINGGGSVGILANLEAPGDIKTLTAISSSPKDIEVTLEPEIGGVPDRRFFVIKSISSAIGVYQVTFAAPCGKKNLIVTVR
jgi:predicted Zn-dependent protease